MRTHRRTPPPTLNIKHQTFNITMGYSIHITDPATGATLHTPTPHNITGSTYAIGGTTELYLSITYNYAPFYYRKNTLGQSTEVLKDAGKYMKTVKPELGGIPGLAYCTIPLARQRVLIAIHNLADEPLDANGNPYQLTDWDIEQNHTLDSYWLPTERNARNALKKLLHLLLLAPDNAKIEIS